MKVYMVVEEDTEFPKDYPYREHVWRIYKTREKAESDINIKEIYQKSNRFLYSIFEKELIE